MKDITKLRHRQIARLQKAKKQAKETNSNNSEQKNDTEQQYVSVYQHIKEISQLKYDSELRREDSLIQQSSHMQTAFSFITAAIFMAAPIMIEYRGDKLSLTFFLVSISSIVFFLLVSLVSASIAQRRYKKNVFMDIPGIEKFVCETYQHLLIQSAQLKQWVQIVGDVQISLAKVNGKRVAFIRISMASFFISIALIIVWFIIGIAKIL